MNMGEQIVPCLPALLRYARKLTRNASEADDLVQDVVVRALQSPERYQEGTNLKAWLLTLVHNRFIDIMRRGKRVSFCSDDQLVNAIPTAANQDRRLLLSDLLKAISFLPADQQRCLALVAVADMSYEEAAEVERVPVGTIRSRLSRARAELERTSQ